MYWAKVCGKRKKEQEVVTPVEDMDFTRPTIRKKKVKAICTPRATIFDPRPNYMGRTNPALEFRSLLLKCTSAVGLHVMAQPQVEEAAEDQKNLDSDHVHFDSDTPT